MKTLPIIAMLLLDSACMVTAQQYRLDYVRATHPWLSMDNAATLTLLDLEHLSDGRISVTNENGGFCNFNAPQSATSYGADVESYYRITPRMVGYGSMSYRSHSQHDVAGSTFIDSQRMPFDLVEDSLTNLGDAHLDTYNIIGGLSYDIGHRIALGAKIDFTAANYAKYKDLRHKNSLTDLTATAGLFAPVAAGLRLGANFYYHRTIEGVTYSLYGTEDKVYRTLIDYGILTGEVETFGENGYTDKNTEQPFVSEQTGFSVQSLWATLDQRLTWTSEFSWRHREGYYGRETAYDIVHNRHHGNVWEASSALLLRQGSNLHQLDFSLDLENLQNDANTYRTVQDQTTTAHHYEYYTPVKMSNKVWCNYSLGYRADLSTQGDFPQWTLTARYSHNQREQTIYYYPYSRHQLLKAATLSASAERNFPLHKGTLGLSGAFAYRWGNGEIYEDRLLAPPSDKQREPATMDTYQEREYQCFVAPQYTADFGLRYSMPIPKAKLDGYVRLSGSVSHLNGSASEWFEGDSRRRLNFTLGAIF